MPDASITRVGVTTSGGNLAIAELHNEPGRALHTLPVPSDSVWRALPRVYQLLGIAGAGSVPEERLYGARAFRPRRIEDRRLSHYIDCGMGPTATPRADQYEVTMTLLSRVEPASPTTTRLETVFESSARPRAQAGNTISCQSTGTLEARVAELVSRVLVGGS